MAFRNGDGNAESTDLEKIDLPTEDEDVKVKLDEPEEDADDDGDDEPAEKAAKPGEQPRKKNGTWAERKKERGADRKAAKAWETERADYDRRLQRIQEENDRSTRLMREELDRIRQAGQGGNRDPFENKLTDISGRINAELAAIEADPNRGYDHYNKLRREEYRLIATQVMAEGNAEQARQQANQPRDQYAARRPIIESEFPWVMEEGYRELAQRARAYKDYLVMVERKPDTLETDREALSHIQAHFGGEYGLRPPPAPPSQRTRGLYAPPPSRGMPNRQPQRREVNLGVMGQGTGLDATTLSRAVREAIDGNE